LLRRAQCLDGLRRRPEALLAAEAAEQAANGNPSALDAIAAFYLSIREYQRALVLCDRACELAPDNARYFYARAVVRRFLGQFDQAEADYDRLLGLDSTLYEAYMNRSNLRTQTPERNHVAALERVVGSGVADPGGETQLRYALAKEYADLGRYTDSWAQLERGAQLRRGQLKFDLAADLAMVDWLIEAFPTGPVEPTLGTPADAPIFIVGLPRSGSTLVERILSSHSQLHAAGELGHFTYAVAAAARTASKQQRPQLQQLFELSAKFDFAALGRDYLARCRPVVGQASRFIDKMPLNYLYCGLIRRALPNARIIHVAREPLAACFAIYKTLFMEGYAFSYDLDELGQYYIAYRRLMDHWQRTMTGVIHDLSYEHLVADQLGETRRLLAYCGLEWEDACLDFHLNPAASTTASAHQVRRPIYRSSVAEWRNYAAQLAGLRVRLEAAGIAIAGDDGRVGPGGDCPA
jgi:tetratricopeptide (TPR) repeat protein